MKKLTQLEKTGSIGKVLISLEIEKSNSIFETRNCSTFLLCHFHVRIWTALIT